MAFTHRPASVFGVPALTLGVANAAGTSLVALSTDSTLLAFDTTNPVPARPYRAPDDGVATVAARRDHGHSGALNEFWFAAIRLFAH